MPRAIYVLAAVAVAVFAVLAAEPGAAQTQENVRTIPVEFPPGETTATLEGHVTGPDSVVYGIAAAESQSIDVTLDSDSPDIFFDVLGPGDTGHMVFSGARQGKHFQGTLAAAGDYSVRVLLSRTAARKNGDASFTLHVSLPGAAPAASGTGG
jgi:hypothetical protein